MPPEPTPRGEPELHAEVARYGREYAWRPVAISSPVENATSGVAATGTVRPQCQNIACFFEYADADGSSDLDAEELLILTGHVGSDASWAWQERTPSQCLKLEDLLMNSIELRTYLYCVYPALEGLLE